MRQHTELCEAEVLYFRSVLDWQRCAQPCGPADLLQSAVQHVCSWQEMYLGYMAWLQLLLVPRFCCGVRAANTA